MKYIMIEQKIGEVTRKIPVIFPEILVHADVANKIQQLTGNESKIINAGNIDISVHRTWGKSSTLKLESDIEDANVINTYDYMHGIIY